jgi:hypothetical protein
LGESDAGLAQYFEEAVPHRGMSHACTVSGAAFVFQLGSLIADTNHASIQLCAITIFMHDDASLPTNS